MSPEQDNVTIDRPSYPAEAGSVSSESIRHCPNGHPLEPGVNQCPTCETFIGDIAPPKAPTLPPIAGYELIKELGRGGMGVVYKARQQRLNRVVALKMMLAGEFANTEARDRFQREAEAVARLQHPNIVQLFESGEANGRAFFSLEFVEGSTLADRLRGDPLQPRDAAQLIVTLASAVQYAHDNGIIHRDLKPANILVSGQGTGPVEPSSVKITDFGLAKHAYQATAHTQTGAVMGTPSYMAPEQARGNQNEIGPATDVYALGAILYELLTGRPPFVAPSAYATIAQVINNEPVSVRRMQEKVPRDLEVICLKCLNKEVPRRYHSARELADDLQRFLDHKPITARPASSVERVLKWTRRRPAIAALWAGAIAVLIGAIVAGFVYNQQLHATKAHTKAEAVVRHLGEVETSTLPEVLPELAGVRDWAAPMLREMFSNAAPGSKERLHASLALLPIDSTQADHVVQQLDKIDYQGLLAVRSILKPEAARIAPGLWQALQDPNTGRDKKLRVACVLAEFAPQDERWRECAPSLAEPIIAAVGDNPGNITPVTKALTPVRAQLMNRLMTIYRNESAEEFGRFMAAHILSDYAADQPALLADLLMDANSKQFPLMFKALMQHSDQGMATLTAELDRSAPTECADDVREKLAKRQANAGAALVSMKMPDKVWPHLKHSQDPRLRSYLIHRIGPLGGDVNLVVDRLDKDNNTSAQRALILSLGRFDDKDIAPELRQRLLPKLQTLYRDARDPGIHSATEWLLWRWKQDTWLAEIKRQWVGDVTRRKERLDSIRSAFNSKDASPQWFLTSQEQMMVAIPGPVNFMMGSPLTEAGRFDSEAIHPMRIDRNFAIASKPVTVAEFKRFKTHKFTERYAPKPDCPAITISWFNAAAYCNWLSERDGIPPEEWCYETDSEGKVVRMKEGYSHRTGYRLPTEAELEYATRSGTVTSRHFGETDELLTHYGWFINNSEDHSWPVGLKMPNDFGLFDVYGNVWNWCQDRLVRTNRPVEDNEQALEINPLENRVVRGGCYVVRPWNMRSANFDWNMPTHANIFYGFRICRTLKP